MKKTIILLLILFSVSTLADNLTNQTCPDCVCNFNSSLSCPSINYSMITFPEFNYSLFNFPGFNYSMIDYSFLDNFTFPEYDVMNWSEMNFSYFSCPTPIYNPPNISCPTDLSCENIVCPSCPQLSCPSITSEEKQSIAEKVANHLSSVISKYTIPNDDGEETITVGFGEKVEVFTEESSYWKETDYDYLWYVVMGSGLIILILLFIKKVRKPKQDEKIEYLEV